MKQILNFWLLFLAIICTSNFILSQEIEKKGIHEMQKNEFGSLKLNQNRFAGNNKEQILALQKNQAQLLSKKVLGFLPYWERNSGAHANLQYNMLTHLACFDFLVKLDASISTPSGWPWTTEINAAHAEGVKVLMTVVNFGGVDGADAVAWELFTNPTKQATFFSNVKNIIQTYSLDGVNIDFESLATTHRGAELNTFMANLTNYIHTELPGKEVSFDGPAVNWGGWIMDELVNSVDYLVVMAYDYVGSSDANSGPVAPLTHHTSWKRFVKRTIETGTYAVPATNTPEKLILAVPYYGQHWKTETNLSESLVTSYVSSTRYRNTVTEAVTHGGWIWNSDFEYPWYSWNDGVNWNQVWADNDESLTKKYDFAIEKNLGGIGIWALNYDGNRPELWSLINSKFGATASLVDDFEKIKIRLYPNPTNGMVQISNRTNLEFNKIEVLNPLGQVEMYINPKNEFIDISNLTNGMYFIRMTNKIGQQQVYKIIKSNY